MIKSEINYFYKMIQAFYSIVSTNYDYLLIFLLLTSLKAKC